jgi:hypothetical protein
MRTVNKVGGANGTIFTEFYGNTTDVKPTEDVPNGSAFYEVDNNMQEYRFDKENKIWYPITRGGTAPSDEYLPLSGGIMTGDINMNGNSLLNAKSIYANDNTDINKVKYISGLLPTNIFINNYNTVGYNLVGINISENTFTFYSNDKNNKHSQIEIIYNVEDNLPRLSFKAGYNDRINLPVLLKGVDTPVDDTDAANKQYVDQENTKYLPLTGGAMSGNINMVSRSVYAIGDLTLIKGVQLKDYTVNNRKYLDIRDRATMIKIPVKAGNAVEDDELVTKSQMETADSKYLPLTGTTEDNPVTGVVTFNGESTITGVSTPVNDTDVVTKKYADDIKTELDDKTNQLNEDTTALQKRQNVLVGSETGNPVSCNDAFAAPLCGLNVYGKSTQDGTPSPDNPVPIVSAGDGGSVTVKVTGKNLLYISDGSGTNRGVTITAKNGLISISGTATENGYAALEISPFIISDVVILSSSITFPPVKLVSQTWKVVLSQNTANKMSDMVKRVVFAVTEGQTYNITGVKIQLELGTTATTYSPYRERLITLPTPNGLPGIPVASGGNYTDPQGQQWVCDEVDFERGVKVQRVDKTAFDSTKTLAEQNVILSSPIETPLTSDEIAAYKALTAYAPDTVVQVSDGAGIKLDYQRDVNIVIKQLTDTIASMTN